MIPSPLVGARGANAAQRARNLQLAPAPVAAREPAADLPPAAEVPLARRPEPPGADLAGAAVPDLKPAPKRSRRKLALIGAVAAIVLGRRPAGSATAT